MPLTKEEERSWLLEQARLVAQNAYAPYSKFQVGCCILFENGDYFLGCNVENSSYGLALCAERNAISTAVTAGEKGALRSVAIVSPQQKKCMPCGACRQWIYEFAQKNHNDVEIVLENFDGTPIVYKISELLPHAFEL